LILHTAKLKKSNISLCVSFNKLESGYTVVIWKYQVLRFLFANLEISNNRPVISNQSGQIKIGEEGSKRLIQTAPSMNDSFFVWLQYLVFAGNETVNLFQD
jgi:hypothetical protein